MKTKKEELQAELTRLNALRKQVKEKLKALPELEVGKWYWVHSSKWDDALIFYNGNEDSFGFSHSGEWTDYYNIGCSKTSPANQEHVNRIFINEAINRGLVNGVKINSLIDGDSAELNGDRYFFNPYPLYFNLGSRHIFANGQWATIIEQDKFAEIKEAHRKGKVIEFRSKYTNFEWKVTLDPAWGVFNDYRIKPEEKPKVGDVCKFWDEYDDVFIVGIYAELRNRDDQWDDNNNNIHGVRLGSKYYTTFFKHAKTITKQEAIDLLFNKGAN